MKKPRSTSLNRAARGSSWSCGAASWARARAGTSSATATSFLTRVLLLRPSARRAEDPGVGDHRDPAALRLRELPARDAGHHALVHLRVLERGGRPVHLRARGAPVAVDDPLDRDLALQARVHRELLLVAIADLRGVVLDHLADELPVHRAHHDRSARRDVHVAVALLAEVPGAGSVPGRAAAAPLRADRADADGLPLPAAAGAGAADAEAAETVAVAYHRPEHVADGAAQVSAEATRPEHRREAAAAATERGEEPGALHDLLRVRVDRLRGGARVGLRGVLLAHLPLVARVLRRQLARLVLLLVALRTVLLRLHLGRLDHELRHARRVLEEVVGEDVRVVWEVVRGDDEAG